MWVVNKRKIFYAFSGILVAASFLSLAVWGLVPGIDFTGGTLIDVSYPAGRPDQTLLSASLAPIDAQASIRPSGSNEYIVRLRPIDQGEKTQVLAALQASEQTASSTVAAQELAASSTSAAGTVTTFDSVGPVLGAEALRKAYVSIFLVIIGIVLFITFAFRKVSEPVSSWKYGLTAIIALVHDVIIPVGAFSVLGHFAGYEVDTLFVTALLVVLGFSVHDTIVVFDRVRENLSQNNGKKSFAEVVGMSISQTFTRSINTSATTLIALVVLYIFGGSTTAHFSLALIVGIAAGTYSSIFIGSPLLVTIEKWGKRDK
ncbi:MAG: protein translocase subunit SecF [Patescibacteria group bacterium]|nr:protein translocase subunit SecF [Patescibacteria group bacterium]MDE2172717.1 protein translocase subunit SecF [Patescibacteria group bacterium]